MTTVSAADPQGTADPQGKQLPVLAVGAFLLQKRVRIQFKSSLRSQNPRRHTFGWFLVLVG